MAVGETPQAGGGRAGPKGDSEIETSERLQRVLAARGVASRRRAEEMIRAGRVSVDGATVTELGTKVDPRAAQIRVDGVLLRAQAPRYLLLNKPRGYITTTSDERDRRTVMELVDVRERVYPVGRLDRDTEGLLLLTNDGDVANRVMHPRYGLSKEYQVLTLTRPPEEVLRRVREGVVVDGRRVVPEEFRLLRESREGLILTITLAEGINHVVRRIMDAVGIPVARLRRVRIGPLAIAGIGNGDWRDLSSGELRTLLESLRLERDEPVAAPVAGSRQGRRPRTSSAGRRTPPDRRPSEGPRVERPAARSGDRTATDKSGQSSAQARGPSRDDRPRGGSAQGRGGETGDRQVGPRAPRRDDGRTSPRDDAKRGVVRGHGAVHGGGPRSRGAPPGAAESGEGATAAPRRGARRDDRRSSESPPVQGARRRGEPPAPRPRKPRPKDERGGSDDRRQGGRGRRDRPPVNDRRRKPTRREQPNEPGKGKGKGKGKGGRNASGDERRFDQQRPRRGTPPRAPGRGGPPTDRPDTREGHDGER